MIAPNANAGRFTRQLTTLRNKKIKKSVAGSKKMIGVFRHPATGRHAFASPGEAYSLHFYERGEEFATTERLERAARMNDHRFLFSLRVKSA